MNVPYQTTLNPPLWELGHIGWFQEYWLARNRQRSLGAQCEPEHPRGDSLLAGADALYDSGRVVHTSRWSLPLLDAVATRSYLAATLNGTLELLDRLPENAGDGDLYFFRLTALHEEMHAEAATYMARGLGIAVPARVPSTPPVRTRAAPIQVPSQDFRVGSHGAGFAFDNELGAHEVRIGAFEIDAEPVRWSAFMRFVDAGGYSQRKWWDDEGWAWLQLAGTPVRAAQDLDPHAAAVHLSAYEADAWCRWAGRRLPTEVEWECAALTARGFDWGEVWEWTASKFEPYPGFRPHPYRDYSQPWFGMRRVLRGACAATSSALAHPRYRNFFEPHRTDIFSGLRSCA